MLLSIVLLTCNSQQYFWPWLLCSSCCLGLWDPWLSALLQLPCSFQQTKPHFPLIPPINSKQNHQHNAYVYVTDFTEALELIRILEHKKGHKISSHSYSFASFFTFLWTFQGITWPVFPMNKNRLKFQITPSPKHSNWSWLWMHFPLSLFFFFFARAIKSRCDLYELIFQSVSCLANRISQWASGMVKDHWTCSQRERDLALNHSSLLITHDLGQIT